MPPPRLCGMPWRTVLLAVLAAGALPAVGGEEAAPAAPALHAGASFHRQTQLDESEDSTTMPEEREDSTTVPEDDTTTPPPTAAPQANENVLSIFQEILDFFYQEVYNSPRQYLVALAAFVLGLILFINGKRFYEGLLVVGVAAVVLVMAMNFVASLWALKLHSPIPITVGIEVALVSAYSAWRGIEGLNIAIGVSFGFFLSFRLQQALVMIGLTSLDATKGSHWGVVVFYTVFVLLLILVFRKEGHLRALAFLSPVLGGLLMTSALSWGITFVAVRGYAKEMKSSMPELSPVEAPWVAFLRLLFELHSKDVGIFADSPYNIEGSLYTTDRLVGWVFWLLFTIIGWLLQKPFRRKAPANKPRVANGRELDQPLLDA
mmetsp:Transcript_53881/g.157174  ORF Transcript_53881/g.157174 Transcript_53881/m.157174 type:complete len:376 (+) Transcript_53881:27-1154(+)